MSKIEEARALLKELNVPSKQQADLCCYVLLAMGVPVEQIENSVRISWGADTDPDLLKAEFSKMLSMAKKLAQ